MPRTGLADLPLHRGRAPRWLFERMAALGGEVVRAVAEEAGPREVLRRLSDPLWFQALGCALGFDWHSSGLTTTVCGALKEGLRGREADTGLHLCGGKGRASRRTPQEILEHCERAGLDPGPLQHASRMAAKVDSSCVQDGFQLYHHLFAFTTEGAWAVVQQGMNEATGYARRYHWLGERTEDFVCEPHAAVVAPAPAPTLNLVAREGEANRRAQAELACQPPARLLAELQRLPSLRLPRRHQLLAREVNPARLEGALRRAHERQPQDFAALVGVPGVGARTLRALALVADLVFGASPSFRDPAVYAWAHGGKDGHPYPVDRRTYDRTIDELGRALAQARVGRTERLAALRRLAALARAAPAG